MHNTVATFEGHSVNWPLEKAGSWHSQRDVDDPDAESGGFDAFNPPPEDDQDDVSCEDFLKTCLAGVDGEQHDAISKHLYKTGLHLATAKAAHLAGDRGQTLQRLNAAMGSWTRLHAGLKSATEGN